jgi:hypothetical protein
VKLRGFALTALVALLAAVMAASVLISGCQSEKQKKQAEFKAEWLSLVSAFEKRVAADDKKGSDLVARNDVAGVIALINSRITSVDGVLKKILDLYPPEQYQRMQAIAIYYLASLLDQLNAQKQLYDAVLAGRPTQDLTDTVGKLGTKTQAVGAELGVELQRLGIKLPATSEDQKQQ